MNGFKDSAGCESCSNSVSSAALLKRRFKRISTKTLIVLLTLGMTFSTTPTQLWAEGAQGIAAAVQEIQAVSGAEGANANGDASGSSDTSAQGASGTEGSSSEAGESGDDSSDGVVSSSQTPASTEGTSSTDPASESQALSAENGIATVSDGDTDGSTSTTLSTNAFALIQSSKDYNSTYSQKYSYIKAGDTLWANMYDEDEDDWYSSKSSVANPGTWTYTWLASDTKGSAPADFTQVLGSDQSLAVSADMAGKYIICKVTAYGKDYYAPASTYDGSFNTNYIPGPVLGAGQAELYSVKLDSSAPSVGDTLTAAAYTSYSQKVSPDINVSYAWYSSASQYSGFTKIDGQTSVTLLVTEDLAGKYIKVEASAGANTVSATANNKVKQKGEVELSAVSIINTKDETSVFAVGDTVKARAKEKNSSYGVFVGADKLNYQWQSCSTQSGTYTDIAGATGETLVLTDALGGKYIKCKVSSKVGTSTCTNSTGAIVAAAGSLNVSVSMSPSSGKVEVGSTIVATAKASGTDVSDDSHVSWQWYKGTSSSASSCTTPIEGATSKTLTVTEALKGYYVVAKANGGYGEKAPYYAAGPVSVAGQVELYDVQFEGTPETSGVHVGDTLRTKVRKKEGSSYNYVGKTDNVSYQWQYASTKSSYDSAYTDIPGATGATYTVDEAYAGKYLRVKVTSDNTVYSTQKKSYYGTSTKDPLGPVTLKGQYTLKSVAPNEAATTTLTAGTTLTPRVKITGSSSWSDSDLPEDANLTLAWYASSDNGATWAEVTAGIDSDTGALTLDSSLVGKKLKLTAYALDNTVQWVSSGSVTPKGTYDLLRVITTPAANSDSTQLVTGDTVKAQVQAVRADGSSTNGIDVTSEASIAWYAADAIDGEYLPIEGVSGSEITLPESVAGKYVKAVATSASSVSASFANAVLAKDSLAAAVQKLGEANTRLSVAYNANGANVNDTLKAELARLGYEGIDVSVAEGGVLFGTTDKAASVGISDSQDSENGNVTFFYMDPNEYTGYNLDGLRSAEVVFMLSRGEETEYYQPSKTVQIAWDEAKLQKLLDDTAADLTVTYASGDSAESVTQNFTLPYRAGSANKFEVTWKSSDTDHVWISASGWSDSTGKITRASSDRDITLTATVKLLSNVSSVDLSGTEDFAITVKGDPEKVAADTKALQAKVDAAFTYDKVTYSGTTTVADKDGLTADLQMPRPATIGVDGKYYQVSYSASTDDVTFNGYKGTVYQPEPGVEAASVKITCTVTDKSNSEVAASKTLDYAIAPQNADDLAAELALMEAAKTGYAAAILNGQDADAVTSNLHAFQKAYLDSDGKLAWAYNTTDASAAGSGIVPVELDGYDDMGTQGWRLFKSSKPSVVSHENLLVTQPEYNTKVSVSAKLSSEKYARYAERYPQNETYAKLANQEVSVALTVKGSIDEADPDEGKTITVTAKVTGVSASDADGNYTAQTVVPLTEVSLAYDDDATAEDVLDELMKKAGCTDLVVGAWGLTSATMSDGRVLDTTSSAPYSYWSFYVNDDYASVGAPQYYLKNGDFVEFRYVKGDGTRKETDTPEVNPSAEHPAVDVVWNGFNNGGAGVESEPLTPTNPTKEASWATQLLTDEQKEAGGYLSVSDPLIIGGKIYLVTGASVYGGKTWNATLKVIDSATGKVEKTVELGSTMDSTCRPICSDGIIIVPLAGGYLQAISATTLETLWYTEAFTKQNVSSLTVSDGYVYINTVDLFGASNTVQNGTVKRVNIETGAVAGSASATDGGYYWAGGVMVNGYYVVGGDFGKVRVYSADLSQLVASISLGSAHIRSSLVVRDGYVYAVTRDDGTLHKLSVAEGGSITEVASVKFAGYSTSTPTFSGDYAFIGGATTNTWTAKGLLSVVNLSDMTVQQITKADGTELMAESKSTPLVASRNGETYVYFTCNGASDSEGYWPNSTYGSGGGVYMYKLGDSEATEVYIPGRGLAQYCMASVVCDAAGNLYYTNDSGNLFCVKSQSHRVTFDSQGGSAVDSQTPADGSALQAPASPERSGYVFCGWYTDAACTQAYEFGAPVTSDLTLYAKWAPASSDDDQNGSNNESDETSGETSGGVVAPSNTPIATASAKAADEGASESAGASKQSSASNGSATSESAAKGKDSSKGASVEGSNEGEASGDGSPIWPYIVLGVGIVGLAGAFFWLILAKRRKKDEQDS